MKRILQRFLCLFGLHDWTCPADQGEPPPPRREGEDVITWFNRYSVMYCDCCGKVYRS